MADAEAILAPRGRCVVCGRPVPRYRRGPAKTCSPGCAAAWLRAKQAAAKRRKLAADPAFRARQRECCRRCRAKAAAEPQSNLAYHAFNSPTTHPEAIMAATKSKRPVMEGGGGKPAKAKAKGGGKAGKRPAAKKGGGGAA